MSGTTSTRQGGRGLVVAALLHLAVLLLGLVPTFAPKLWGAHALGFLPPAAIGMVGALAMAFGLLVLRAPAFPMRSVTQLAAALAALPLFLLLRDETHLLGDGRLWVSVLGGARVYHAHEPLAFAAARVVTMGLPSGDAAGVAGRLEAFSIVLGVAAIWLLLRIAGQLGALPRARWAAFGLLAGAGALQFGAGYVEAYPLLWVALLAVVDAALRLGGGGGAAPFVLAATVGIAIGVHGMAALMLPATAWFLWSSSGTASRRVVAATLLAVPVVLGYGLLPYLLPSVGQMSEGVETTAGGVLQIVRGLKPYPWGPAAWALDQLNRWTLAAPLTIPLLVFAALARRNGRARNVVAAAPPPARRGTGRRAADPAVAPHDLRVIGFLLAAGIPLALPGLVLDTEAARGAAVDWDAFAVAVVPLSVLAALLHAPVAADARGARAAALAVAVGLLGTLAFLAVNADPPTAVRRFDSVARHTFRTPRARAWGFEALAGYRRDSGDMPGALEAYERALDAMPKHPRLLSNTATLYSRGNRHAEAAALYRRMTEAAPADYNGWFYWGVEAEVVGRFEEAERGYRGALRVNERATDAMIGLARVLLRSPGGRAEARALLERTLELAPNQQHAAGIRQTLESLNEAAPPPGR